MALATEGSRVNGAVVLRVVGRVDGETAPELDRVCQQWLAPDDSHMILDFTEVAYISSAGLSSVLRAGKEMDRQGGRLLICGLSDRLRQLFAFSGFDTLFPVFETREAAINACGKKAVGRTNSGS